MIDGKLKVEPLVTDRSEIEAARAAPVSLPAGSYDASELSKIFGDAAKAKNDANRGEMVAKAVEDLNEVPLASSGLPAGYKRVETTDEVSGATEFRTVYDPELAEKAAVDEAEPAAGATAARRATKGE